MEKIEEEKREIERQRILKVREEARQMSFASAMKDFIKSKVIKTRKEKVQTPKKKEKPVTVVEDRALKLMKILKDDKRVAEELLKRKEMEEEAEREARKEEEQKRSEMFEEQRKYEHEKKIRELEKMEREQSCIDSHEVVSTVKSTALLPLLAKFEHLAKLSKEEERASRRISRKERKAATRKSKQILCKIKEAVKKSASQIKISTNEDQELSKTKSDMKNYLLSQVLFDRQENLITVSRQEEEEKASEEVQQNLDQKYFEMYKQNMEDYLQLFDDDKSNTCNEKRESLLHKPKDSINKNIVR